MGEQGSRSQPAASFPMAPDSPRDSYFCCGAATPSFLLSPLPHLWAEWAEQLTKMGRGKHFIGDFLPPDELEKFMETFKALKVGWERPQTPAPAVSLSSRQPAQCPSPSCSLLRWQAPAVASGPLAHKRGRTLLPRVAPAYDRCHLCRELANSISTAALETFAGALGKFCFQWSQLNAVYRQSISQADAPMCWALQSEIVLPMLLSCSRGEG